MAKPKTIADRVNLASKWSTEIPFYVRKAMFEDAKARVCYGGDRVSIGEGDYSSIEEMRDVIEWFVTQFNGTVKWEREK